MIHSSCRWDVAVKYLIDFNSSGSEYTNQAINHVNTFLQLTTPWMLESHWFLLLPVLGSKSIIHLEEVYCNSLFSSLYPCLWHYCHPSWLDESIECSRGCYCLVYVSLSERSCGQSQLLMQRAGVLNLLHVLFSSLQGNLFDRIHTDLADGNICQTQLQN